MYSPNQLESAPCFHCASIPTDKKPYNMLGMDGQQFLELQEKAATPGMNLWPTIFILVFN